MSNPFRFTLNKITSKEANVSGATLKELLGYISHQEDKVYALQQNLVPSLYFVYMTVAGEDNCEEVRRIVLQLYQSLVLLLEGRERVMANLGTEKLLQFLSDSDYFVRIGACKVLEIMARFSECLPFMIKQDEAIVVKTLLALIQNDPHPDVVTAAVAAVAHLLAVYTDIEAPSVEKLVTMMNANSAQILMHVALENTPGTVRSIANEQTIARCWKYQLDNTLALVNICSTTQGKQLALKHGSVGAVEVLLKLAPGSDLLAYAVRLLMMLTVLVEGKAAVINCPYLIDCLCDIVLQLDRQTSSVCKNAIRTIQNIADHTTGVHRVGLLLIQDVYKLRDILGEARAGQVLEPLFLHPVYQVQALKALTVLLETSSGHEAAWACLELVPKLATIISRSSAMVAVNIASHALYQMCSNNKDALTELVAVCKKDNQAKESLLHTRDEDLRELSQKVLFAPKVEVLDVEDSLDY